MGYQRLGGCQHDGVGDKTCSLVHFTQGGVEKELNKLGGEDREAFATYRTADGRNLGGYAAPA